MITSINKIGVIIIVMFTICESLSAATRRRRRKCHACAHPQYNITQMAMDHFRRALDLSIIYPSRGPKRNATYNPHYSFEPYWPNGEWVFDDVNQTDIVCGKKCLPIYKDYGQICARSRVWEYRTFPTYCDMWREDCNGMIGWMVVYRGECLDSLKTHPDHLYTIMSNPARLLEEHSERMVVALKRIKKEKAKAKAQAEAQNSDLYKKFTPRPAG